MENTNKTLQSLKVYFESECRVELSEEELEEIRLSLYHLGKAICRFYLQHHHDHGDG